MQIVGMSYNTTNSGQKYSKLYVLEDFESYLKNPDAGRNCFGKCVSVVDTGYFDISNLKIGMEVAVYYGKARQGQNGKIFQPIEKIEILTEK